MKHTGYNNVVSSLGNSVANGFDFLGKENLEIGGVDLKLTEMDFRKYDVALGRFNGIDLLAEDGQFSITPYHYAGNNPVLFSDPSGLKKQDPILKLEEPMWQPEGGYFQLYNMGGNFYNNLTNGSNLGGGVPGASGAMGGYGYGTLYSTDFFDNGREQAAWSDAVTKLVNSVNFVDNGFDPEFEQNLSGIIVTDENKALLNIIDLINDAGYHYYDLSEYSVLGTLNTALGAGSASYCMSSN
jgi:RHS repeat-associated protein